MRKSGKLKITEVLPHSPAALAKIKVGEDLRAVDGVAIGPHVNLDELLQHKVDKRVALDISGQEVIVRPVASLAEQIYRKWIEDNRAYVAKISNGRLGYVHIRDMSETGAHAALYRSRCRKSREVDGVVIDIRNNNGGFVNAIALDVLSRRPYLTMTNRGGPPGPARTVLGQTVAGTADDSGRQSALAFGRRGFYGRLSDVEVGKSGRRADRGVDHLHRVDGTGGRQQSMRMPGTLVRGRGRKEYGVESAPRGYRGHAADRGIVYGAGFAA